MLLSLSLFVFCVCGSIQQSSALLEQLLIHRAPGCDQKRSAFLPAQSTKHTQRSPTNSAALSSCLLEENMKAVDTTITLIALAVLTPAAAFAPSASSRTAIRRNRGKNQRIRMHRYAVCNAGSILACCCCV